MSSKPDIVGVIEAAYRVEQGEAPWLTSILEASRPLLDRGLGVLGAVYDVSETARPEATASTGFDLPPKFDVDMREAFRGLSTDCVRGLVTTSGCHVIPWERRFCEVEDAGGLASLPVVPSIFGPSDMVVINAADPTGRGCFVSANHARKRGPSRTARALWDRLAVHLSAGLRLRHRLGSVARAKPEAVLATSGRVEHAEEPAKSAAAREALRLAALSQERARGSMRRRAPEQAVEEWKGLVAARWTLREHFDHDGKRYLLAERNDPRVRWIEELTEREQQVVAFASLGQWNKLIAYELGIADSTVRVLLSRAASKAGVRTRGELVERFVRDRMLKRSTR